MPQVGNLARARTLIGNSMQICLPIYRPPSSPVVVILFVVIFVVWACPNDNLIRFYFLSQHHILTFFLSFFLCLFKRPVIEELIVTLDMNRYQVLKMWKFTYLYTWQITNVTWYHLYRIWPRLNRILADSLCATIQLEVQLGCGVHNKISLENLFGHFKYCLFCLYKPKSDQKRFARVLSSFSIQKNET